MSKRKKIQLAIFLFIVGVLINLAWENLHAGLYLHYRGNLITSSILFRASLVDGLVIALLYAFSLRFAPRRVVHLAFCVLALCFAIGLEVFALKTNRWSYAGLMPLVPFFHVGWSPAVQLAITGILSWWVSTRILRKR